MKKLIFLVMILTGMVNMINAQNGVPAWVADPLIEATISGNITPLCWGGNSGTLTGIDATGGMGNYTYQWQRSTDNIVWSNILSATALAYTPGTMTTAGDFYYRRIVHDDCGYDTTNVLLIQVYQQFTLGATSGGNTPICFGEDGGILTSPAAIGGAPGVTYQWQSSLDGSTWSDITGETTTTYAIGTLTDTTHFRIVAMNTCDTLYGNVKTIIVHPLFTEGIATLVGSANICPGTDPGNITATAATGGAAGTTSYQWQRSTDAMVTWSNILGATAQNYDPSTLAVDTWFRRMDKNTCDTLYTNWIFVDTYDALTAGIITMVGNDTICHSTDPGFFTSTASTGGAPGTTYQWQLSINNGATWSDITGATTQDYDPAVLDTTTMFRRQTTNTCGVVYSNIVTIKVWLQFNPGVIGNEQHICNNTAPNQYNFIIPPTGGDGNYTYQWISSTTNLVGSWTDIPGATGTSYQSVPLTTTTYFSVRVSNTCGLGYPTY